MIPFGGMKIVVSPHLPPERFIDRTKVRSPSRAARRWRQGKRKASPWSTRPGTKAYQIGDMLVVSPAVMAELKASMVTIDRKFGEVWDVLKIRPFRDNTYHRGIINPENLTT